jgi:hypothetical protein
VTWKASSTRTACGKLARSAEAYPRYGSSDAVWIPARQVASRWLTQLTSAYALRSSITSSSRAGRPPGRVKSMMPVTKLVDRVADAAWNAVSSNPSAATPASRVGSLTRGEPCSRTAPIAVRHPMPNSRATAATEAPSSPTRRQISARARSVSDARGEITGEVSVQVRFGRVRAAPDPIDPHQRDRPPTRRRVTHPDRAPVMRLGHRPALRAPHQVGGRLDRLLQLAIVIRHGQHHEPGQTQHRRRCTTLSFHLGPLLLRVLNTTDHEAPGPFPGSG